jgi:pimeloyl-ACP methyl ester carboxylesterase
MPMDHVQWTRSGVRMRARARSAGNLNWLFLPGGPGIGSESLHELVDAVDVPGTAWLVDLPGDGSNTSHPSVAADPYASWPAVLLEAAAAVDNPIYVGHSTGGMYLLSTAVLEQLLVGMVLISTAPDASWLPAFHVMCEQNALPAVAEATRRYERAPSSANLAAVAVASAPWNFTAEFVAVGAELLARMPYNGSAVSWSDDNFDDTYQSTWWPTFIPTLIVSGSDDRVVAQTSWSEPRFSGPNVVHRTIQGGAHFPWIERPDAVRAAFSEFSELLTR